MEQQTELTVSEAPTVLASVSTMHAVVPYIYSQHGHNLGTVTQETDGHTAESISRNVEPLY